MSNSIFIIGILVILLAGVLALVLAKLLFKKSVFFKIVAVITFPILNAVIMGFIVGYMGLTHITWAAPWAIVLILGSYAVAARIVQRPLNEMNKKIDSLSKGDLDIHFDEKMMKGGSETAMVMRKLSEHVSSLKNIAEFADHVGKGKLDAEYALLGENDSLGKAMLGMRANLQTAELEMGKSRREDEQRNWATQGLAKFAEILRNDNDNLETLSNNIISNLVKYLDANQGGIFILNDAANNEEKFLEMKACYAFDRKKFVEKQIQPGEGLVGTCYLEGEPIYMTEVPESYISITSGLGDSNPRALLIVPLKLNEVVYGVVEIASFNEFEPYVREFVEKVSESIASTISSVKVNLQTNKLLVQTKLQAEEMANQEEELRQNMEEMQATQEEMFRREAELKETLEQMNEVRKAAEEEEHEMRQFYDAILESNNMVELSADGVVTSVNQNLLNLFNVDKSVFIGKHVSAIIGEEAASAAWASLAKGRYYEDVQTPDAGSGKKITVRQKFMPIRNMQGKLLRVLLLVFPESK